MQITPLADVQFMLAQVAETLPEMRRVRIHELL